jgi:FkbM family methyltransferase
MDEAEIDRLNGTVVTARIQHRVIKFFVVNPNDTISRHHYRGCFYEQEGLDLISRAFRGGTFVDIGAHIGNHAIYVATFLAPKEVIVFEPNPAAIAQFKLNAALNECKTIDTRFLGLALGNSERRFNCRTPNPNNLGHTLLLDAPDGEIRSVVADSILQSIPVDFIKLDVEGMELEILAGLSATLFRWRPTLFIEVFDHRREEFNHWLSEHSYRVVQTHRLYQNIANYLCSP